MNKYDSQTTDELMLEHFSKKTIQSNLRSGNICYSYDRVSSRDQMTNGNSLIWQYERIDEHAVKNNLIIKSRYGGTYESAKTDERKEFQRMLADIKKDRSIVAIIVYSYDRFSRSGANGIFLLENLRKLGVRIIAITQEVDSLTPTGSFQENLYMLLSKLDNDMRRDKSVSGTRSIIRKGFWPYSTPIGYTNTNKHATADKHCYEINDKGILLKKAFEWKASGKYTNQQIIKKLHTKGLDIRLKYIAWIFANPFYCGYVYSSLLPGELIPGKHPTLIDKEVFLIVNEIKSKNPISGIPKVRSRDELPLKVFMKDAVSGSPFTGYLKKGHFYYKSRNKGTKINVAATKMNASFEELLQYFEYDKKYKVKLQELLTQKLGVEILDKKEDVTISKKKVTELRHQLDKLEERFVLSEISQELFEKFSKKYKTEITSLNEEIERHGKISSNLEKAVQKGLDYAENLSQSWISADYTDKQQLQYLVFPDGIQYDKKNDGVRTNRVNSLFLSIAEQVRVIDEIKKGDLLKDRLLGSSVG
ncbi:MAG: recombinase family protein [Bacteroidota bacterium]